MRILSYIRRPDPREKEIRRAMREQWKRNAARVQERAA